MGTCDSEECRRTRPVREGHGPYGKKREEGVGDSRSNTRTEWTVGSVSVEKFGDESPT